MFQLNEKGVFVSYEQHKRNYLTALQTHPACEYGLSCCN